jgi:uncharacterized protein
LSELPDMKKNQSKIIVDTNLWISYLISKGYKRLDRLIFNNKARLVFSSELIDEFIEVSQRPKFIKYFHPDDISKLLDLFDTYGELVKVKSEIKICRDIKDNFLLALANDSKADYLLTGDNDLLELKKFGKTMIISMSEFERQL